MTMAQSSADMLRSMIDYNFWVRDRVLGRLPFLPVAFYFAAAELDHGNMHRTLVHILQDEIVCRRTIQGLPAGRDIKIEDAQQLERAWREEEARWRELAAGLTDDDATRPISYDAGGLPATNALWEIVFQIVSHGTQHFGEVAMAMTKQGHSPGNLDYMEYVHP